MDEAAKTMTIIRVPDLPEESFTEDERRALTPYFTNLDRPVFALRNLPEVVKGALFARYSRSAKTMRRLFLDEFLNTGNGDASQIEVGTDRADRLYGRMFDEYGDDSVAQLGGAHVACEGASNVLTKILERGRLMAYLEQSTRYVPYTGRPGGHWKYLTPPELNQHPLRDRYQATLDDAFQTYSNWIEPAQDYYRQRHPQSPTDSDGVYRAAIRAKALDTLRGLLPAATRSNVGIFGTGQAFEQLLLRLRAHPLAEARDCADLMLPELRLIIPAFLTRVDREDRGVRWSRYLTATRSATRVIADQLLNQVDPVPDPGSSAHGVRPRRRGQGGRRRPIRIVPAVGEPVAGHGAENGRRRQGGGAARVRGYPNQPPSSTWPSLRANNLLVRDAVGLRCLPRPATPPSPHH